MGSDMAMEANSYRPRASYAQWDGDDLVVYKDYPISGYCEYWRGQPNLNDRTVTSLLRTMVMDIPEKPVPVEKRLASAIDRYDKGLTTRHELIEEIKEILNGETRDD